MVALPARARDGGDENSPMLDLLQLLAIFWILAIAAYALADLGLRLLESRSPDESRRG